MVLKFRSTLSSPVKKEEDSSSLPPQLLIRENTNFHLFWCAFCWAKRRKNSNGGQFSIFIIAHKKSSTEESPVSIFYHHPKKRNLTRYFFVSLALAFRPPISSVWFHSSSTHQQKVHRQKASRDLSRREQTTKSSVNCLSFNINSHLNPLRHSLRRKSVAKVIRLRRFSIPRTIINQYKHFQLTHWVLKQKFPAKRKKTNPKQLIFSCTSKLVKSHSTSVIHWKLKVARVCFDELSSIGRKSVENRVYR